MLGQRRPWISGQADHSNIEAFESWKQVQQLRGFTAVTDRNHRIPIGHNPEVAKIGRAHQKRAMPV